MLLAVTLYAWIFPAWAQDNSSGNNGQVPKAFYSPVQAP